MTFTKHSLFATFPDIGKKNCDFGVEFAVIEKMLTNKKFKEFFQKNVAAL